MGNLRADIIGQYRLDYSRRYYIRELGKILGVSHVTLLPHLQQLEKDGILISKVVGKNKEYRLNHSNFLVKDLLCISEKQAALDFFIANRKNISFYENICDLRIHNSILCNSDLSEMFVIGDLSNDLKEKINLICKKFSIKIIYISSEDFYHKFLTHDVEVKKILKSRIIISNPDFIVNLLWRNYVQAKKGEDL